MKVVLFVICAATLAYAITDEQKEKIKAAHDKCQADPASHVDESEFKHRPEGHPDPKKLGPHTFCMTKQFHLQKEDGSVNKEAVRKALTTVIKDEAKLNEAVDECAAEKPSPEETATHIFKCFFGHSTHPIGAAHESPPHHN